MIYRVIAEFDNPIGTFNAAVQAAINDGWHLHGSVSVAIDAGERFFAQAITRPDNESEME